MTGTELLDFLQEELGDDLQAVTRFDESEYEILYKSEFVERFFQEFAEKTIDEIHEDLRLTTMRTCLDSDSYGADIRCLVLMTEITVGYQLILNEKEGVYFAVSPETDVRFPSFVYECLARLDP